MKRKYYVSLDQEQLLMVQEIVNSKNYSHQKRKRAHVLLLANDNDFTNEQISQMTGISIRGIEEIYKRFVLHGFKNTIYGKPRCRLPLMDPIDEERLRDMAQELSQNGKKLWTLKKLSQEFVTNKGLKVSMETVRRVLKKFEK
jgi:transposase